MNPPKHSLPLHMEKMENNKKNPFQIFKILSCWWLLIYIAKLFILKETSDWDFKIWKYFLSFSQRNVQNRLECLDYLTTIDKSSVNVIWRLVRKEVWVQFWWGLRSYDTVSSILEFTFSLLLNYSCLFLLLFHKYGLTQENVV